MKRKRWRIACAWMRGTATAVLLTLMTSSSGAASDRVFRAVLSEDAATVEAALRELPEALYGPMDRQWSVDSVGAFFREDVDLASWLGEVLATGRPEARAVVSWQVGGLVGLVNPLFTIPERLEFAARNYTSAKEMFDGGPDSIVDFLLPTMERLRSTEYGGLLASFSEDVTDDEARRLALGYASQMRRIHAALPGLVEDEYDRRQRSGTLGAEERDEVIFERLGSEQEHEVLDVLLSHVASLQEHVGTEETRVAAWTTWVKEREARGLPVKVVGVEAPWNLFGMSIAHSLGESGSPLEGRALAPGIRRVALALTAEPGLADRLAEEENLGLEAAVALLANERPLAEETGKRVLDLYCESVDGRCIEKLNLLYAGPDDPSLRSLEAAVGGRIVNALTGLVEETERECGVLAAFKAEAEQHGWSLVGVSPASGDSDAADALVEAAHSSQERIWWIGEELQDVLALVGRLDSVPRPVLEGVFKFWSTERFPEARRILEDNDWLEPDVAAAPSEQREGARSGLSPRRGIGPAELCRGK